MVVNIFLLILLIAAALWTVLARSLLRAAIALAFTSVMLTIIMFRLDSWMAGVFELSVCTGLISVIFVTVISLTQALSQEEIIQHMKDRLVRFWYLPLIVVITGLVLSLINVRFKLILPPKGNAGDAGFVLWNLRQLDLVGQILVLLAGGLGVAVLFIQYKKKK
ncbi:hypothetical protein EPO66_02785 [bacterium]|nr:MAG: hypothetical protein EPO66_02785 [bacterium]